MFIDRWSKQKGVDLIADVVPSLLEKRPSIQLIWRADTGPVEFIPAGGSSHIYLDGHTSSHLAPALDDEEDRVPNPNGPREQGCG